VQPELVGLARVRGETVEAQATDIDAVIKTEHLTRYHLVAHSMGVPYALSYALAHPLQVASFTAADYRPGLLDITLQWAEIIEAKPATVHFDRSIARRMVAEHTAKFIPDISKFDVPVLAILGTRSADRDFEDDWKKAPRVQILWIEHGHDTFTNADARAALARIVR